MNPSDPYEVLGVAPDATEDELKSAYRQLVLELHPDTRAPGIDAALADEALRRVTLAWQAVQNRHEHADDPLGAGADDRGADIWSPHDPLAHGPRRFPWWVVAIAVLMAIFVITAYAGSVAPTPP